MSAVRVVRSSLRAPSSASFGDRLALGGEVGVAVDLDQRRRLAVVGGDADDAAFAGRPLGRATPSRPSCGSTSIAFSMSPPASVSIFLHSIMPWPVLARSSLTSLAVISAMLFLSKSIVHS